METKYCLDCESKIIGRSDKKFCSDACRNNFNNKLNSDTVSTMRNINYALRKNRRILQSLIPDHKQKINIPKTKLINEGFNFEFLTHVKKSKAGNTYIFCYDYGYKPMSGENLIIVRHAV